MVVHTCMVFQYVPLAPGGLLESTDSCGGNSMGGGETNRRKLVNQGLSRRAIGGLLESTDSCGGNGEGGGQHMHVQADKQAEDGQ
jgi:hypothetical protein